MREDLDLTNKKTIIACRSLYFDEIIFMGDHLCFCCGTDRNLKPDYPVFPWLEDAESTIRNVLQAQKNILYELNNDCEINAAKPCIGCTALKPFLYKSENNRKFKHVNISCYPSPCQAKCIYCTAHTDPQNSYENAIKSPYPKLTINAIRYLQNNKLLSDDCIFLPGPAEITIMPDKDVLLDNISNYKTWFPTNGFIFEPKIADSLSKNNSYIMVSIDSGAKETFKQIKGLDLFDKVVNNLKRYKSYGDVKVKYIIMPGINDTEKDINGIISILKSLDIKILILSYDFGAAFRNCFYAMTKFIQELKENKLTFDVHFTYTFQEIEDFISKYNKYDAKIRNEHEKKYHHLSEVYQKEYINDYKAYREYLYSIEIEDLIMHFDKNVRFALLGTVANDKYAVNTFKRLGIPLQTPDAPYEEAFDKAQEFADIFIIRNKEKYNDVRDYIESKGGSPGQLLNLENYYLSFEPAKLFLGRSIDGKYLAE